MKENSKARVQNFYKRWNIKYDDYGKRISDFKNRVLITLQDIIKPIFDNFYSKALLMKYFKLIGLYVEDDKLYNSWGNYRGGEFFIKEIESQFLTANLSQIIFLLQNLFYLNLDVNIKDKLYKSFKEDIDLSLMDISIKKMKDGEYIFYPSGAELLDEGVVNDVLDWLTDYPESCKSFESALKKYQEHKYEWNLIDDLRISLELLLKSILKNEKSLDNQKESSLGRYLEGKNVPEEIRNMFATLIAYYVDYQNEYVKHGDRVDRPRETEVEFMIYLTGTFMRFLLSLEANLNNSK